MKDIEILTKKEGVIINPNKEHYKIGSPKKISISTKLDYRVFEIIYESKVPSEAIGELSRFANDYFLSQMSSEENIWKTEFTSTDLRIISSCSL